MLRGTGVALVSGALLLASCGDDDGGVPAADDQKTADEAIAAVERALRDDGFDAVSPDDDDDNEDDNNSSFQSEECREFEAVSFPQGDEELPGETARATQGFTRGTFELGSVGENVSAMAAFVEQPEDLDPLFEALNDERLEPCVEEALRVASEDGAEQGQTATELGDVEIERLEDEGLGDADGGYQVTAEASGPGGTIQFSFAQQYVRVDRAVVAVNVLAVGNEEPTADRTALLRVLVDGLSDQSA